MSGLDGRYGLCSTYAPRPQPWLRGPGCTHVAPDSCARCSGGDTPVIGPGWDPGVVLRAYVETAAANGAQWAIDQLGGAA